MLLPGSAAVSGNAPSDAITSIWRSCNQISSYPRFSLNPQDSIFLADKFRVLRSTLLSITDLIQNSLIFSSLIVIFQMPKKVMKSPGAVYSEWDALAETRFHQITSGDDLTFNHVLAPCLIEIAKSCKPQLIIDAGCGVGVLCDMLADMNVDLVGVDPSWESIALAKKHFGGSGTFVCDTLEGFAKDNAGVTDLVLSNMVIMDVTDLKSFVAGIARVLKPGGRFVFSMGHPCFWPHYADFAKQDWYNYSEEQMVETPFRISRGTQPEVPYTHIHRPLALYTKTLKQAGLVLEQLIEPLPTPEIEARYPKKWDYPRFLIMEWRKI